MRYCKKCVMPDTKPDLFFNEDGVCDGAGYCIIPTCTDSRDNATVCAGWVCGQRRDDCNLFRNCGVCSAPTTCDFAGSCIAPPPAIVSIVETNRKLIPIMTSWGTGPLSSWGYYSGCSNRRCIPQDCPTFPGNGFYWCCPSCVS